ncbi:MAG: chorismate mutase [Pseudomonadota bacterium]
MAISVMKADNEPVGRAKTAAECETMADVRAEIDRLDRALVAMLAERQTYIEAAGRIKADRGTVRDPARIEDVVTKVLAEARAQGLSPAIAEPVWRSLIEQCIAHEFEIWDGLRQNGE